MRHGTEGWKCLETSMKAFQQLVEGTGPAVAPYITEEVQDLLHRYACADEVCQRPNLVLLD